MNAEILKATGLYKSYGSIAVLKDVSLDMRAGEVHAVIGPNGAGKTTLFKTLSGELPPDAGQILLDGKRVDHLDGHQRVRLGVGRTFQVARIFNEDSVLNNMIVAVEARRHLAGLLPLLSFFRIAPMRQTSDEAMSMLASMKLDQKADHRAGVLAYGDRKRLELTMSLALQPRLLMLDEPMAGMSPTDRIMSVDMIRMIVKERGISVLLTEHDMDVVFALADHITVLNYGEIIASGSPSEVRASPKVREVYLGHEAAHA